MGKKVTQIQGGRMAGKTAFKHNKMLEHLIAGCTLFFGNEDSWQGFRKFMNTEEKMPIYTDAFKNKRIIINTNY